MRLTLILFALVAATSSGVLGQDVPPVPVQPVVPNYPTEVLAKIHGNHRVDLFLEIDKNGRVKDVTAFGPWKTCSGNDDRADSILAVAVESAKQIVFSPARRGDHAVEGNVVMFYPVAGTMPPKPETGPTKKGAVVNGQRVLIPVPRYPSKAKKFGIQGEVKMLAQIDEQGKIYSVLALSGHPVLFRSAADAACGAKFTPTTLAGEPVKVGVPIVFKFVP